MSVKEKINREFKFTRKDFNRLKKISSSYTGIIVTDDKYDMYYSRLVKRVRSLGLKDFSAYVEYLNINMNSEFTPFINCITTNLTSFFREDHHFEKLKKEIIPELIKRKKNGGELKLWSAGC